MDISSRLKIIEDLDDYLSEKKKFLLDMCCDLGWTEESLKQETKVQCPHNPGHWILESSLGHHTELCALVKDGYLKEEMEKQPPNSTFFYQQAPSVVSITLDKETQASILMEKGLIEQISSRYKTDGLVLYRTIFVSSFNKYILFTVILNVIFQPLDEMPDVPKTVDRWTVELNPEQRLAEYDYIIAKAKAINKAENDTLEDLMFDFEKKNDQDDRPKTHLEILAEQRDYKRRRQSYRAKNVHITKKSYTEVMKEVIENQISMLTEMRKEENNEKEANSNTEEKKVERRKRERSHSPRELSQDRQWHGSKNHHRSKSKRSRSRTPKKKKHKHNRSRSRSRSRSKSRKHKKSHRLFRSLCLCSEKHWSRQKVRI
ncbi:U11/U12 small nuclear ribonucleoprotein 48 like protein [Argiope bruennichi]|uniref:U11/U12 small nuclear ribonucleoprotein 48 like protein n=1 Tax=Argiope bruennichi TaxID=94029 RepID=A0A8T0E8A8_ARGBR|nr:U11/U12 small nuclear ribonucleoprotein 48 like protein [Argiope bruennichi]